MIRVSDIGEKDIVIYDIETTDQYAPYTELKMIGAQYGLRGDPHLVESWGQRKRFKSALADPDILKVSFNGFNFDNPVLYRHGYPVNEKNSHDVFLMAKTVGPRLPAYSLKFLSWWFFGDFHQPEMDVKAWLKQHGRESLWEAPKDLLARYCLHDVQPQTNRLFRMFWEIVQRPLHWEAYTNIELPMMMPLEEMMLRGGEYLDEGKIKELIATLQEEKGYWEDDVYKRTNGAISNPNSVKQVGAYLRDEEGIELELTDKDNFSLKKADVLEFLDLDNPDRDRSKIIRALFEVRKINNTLSYYRNYLTALNARPEDGARGWIPKQYSISGARTRRTLSNSKYKLNFQNPNEEAKEVQIVPDGWLGVWMDATQIENVVHIHATKDHARRIAYENDEEFNEYIWLCNQVLGGKRAKKELDAIPSPFNPAWSVYKQFKTLKLAANFGLGVTKFCKTAKLAESAGRAAYAQLHRVCPAIKQDHNNVAKELNTRGYIQDVFGHIYSGPVSKAYKIAAYRIQGCGTGSLSKAQIRANYDTLHQWDQSVSGKAKPTDGVVTDTERKIDSYGVLCGTTHDEIQARISLLLGEEKIIATLQEMMYNMTEKFSPRFDNIPLRAKMYLSRTTPNERKEVSIKDLETIRTFLK